MTTQTQHPVIGFIGGGNMAHCLISGLIAAHYPTHCILASDPNPEKLEFLSNTFHIHTTQNNQDIIAQADILILAVKPQAMKSLCQDSAPFIQEKKPLIMSIAAGINEKSLSQWLGNSLAIVRCMPNISAFVGSGVTGMFANPKTSALQRDLAQTIFSSVGITLWVTDEKLINVIAALSGSGPAYLFFVMEALEKSAIQLGLSPEDAHLLTLQTTLGAARLGLSTSETLTELRERVTSKGGMTEKAIAILEMHHVRDIFEKTLNAAHARSIELSM